MKIFSVLLLTIMVAIAAKKSMARYLLVKTSDGEDTDITKPQSYPECRKNNAEINALLEIGMDNAINMESVLLGLRMENH